jgi:hypothetical protein
MEHSPAGLIRWREKRRVTDSRRCFSGQGTDSDSQGQRAAIGPWNGIESQWASKWNRILLAHQLPHSLVWRYQTLFLYTVFRIVTFPPPTEVTMGRWPGSSEEVRYRWTSVDCNTHVHGSNARNFSVELSLFQTSKSGMSFLLLLMSSLYKIGEEGRTGSAWKQGKWGKRWPKQCMHIWINE